MAAPLIGVAVKTLNFGRAGVAMAGLSLTGHGEEPGSIVHVPSIGRIASAASVDRLTNSPALPSADLRGAESRKGSLLVYPKVELKWNSAGDLIQDTFLALTNDFSADVRVQLYFVHGDQAVDAVMGGDPPRETERAHDGCNWVDNVIVLTGDEPTYWSALTGGPKGVSPFTILDPGVPRGRPDPDIRNPGGRMLRGYILAWAVNADGVAIRWNHLAGSAVVANYRDRSAWEYNAWSFQAPTAAALSSPSGAPGYP